jgi:histidinol dehydrogenase
VRAERLRALAGEEAARAAEVRARVPGRGSVAAAVAEIVASVRDGGDAALAAHVARLDAIGDAPVRVAPEELHAALRALEDAVRAGLEVAIANVRAVAEAGVGADALVELPQGHSVTLRELPVRSAGIYVPGGRAPYPSTVVMGVVAARAAGVADVAVCAPGSHPVILAACALCGADRVYRMGGAQAVAALAYGTETIARVDVIAGPGNLYVQEAKRLVSGDVGIDGFLGPSDVLVVADAWADPELAAADLLAQAEHGDGTIVCLASEHVPLLDAVAGRLAGAPETGAVAALVEVEDPAAGVAFAEAFAPEHLELVGPGPEALAGAVRSAGCVFVGAAGATAFGDYVAGSNHSLPTGGAARFASALGPAAFRRRMAVVRIGGAAAALAAPGAAVAEAEGFAGHARSMRLRENQGR